jgi:hypothetical protein
MMQGGGGHFDNTLLKNLLDIQSVSFCIQERFNEEKIVHILTNIHKYIFTFPTPSGDMFGLCDYATMSLHQNFFPPKILAQFDGGPRSRVK